MKQTLLFVITSMLLLQSAIAGVIKGKVTDSKGNPLPYATIYVQGTTTGANASMAGSYELTLSPGLYTVICQYVGYKQAKYNVNITGDETNIHDFKLASDGVEMKEVVVRATDEDPAYRIIRQAIKQRKYHQGQIQSFQTGIYLKGQFRTRQMPKKVMGQKIDAADVGADSTGKGILYLVEEDADYYAQGDKTRTVIHSVRQSGNPRGLGFSQIPSVISFYDNNVRMLGGSSRGFVSPVADGALGFYRYKLLGQTEENGKAIYKIQVTPKRAYEPCFNGLIYIVSDEYAIHSTNLLVTKESGLDQLDTVRVDQLYIPTKSGEWVIKSQVFYFTIKLFGFDAVGSFVNVYNQQKVNEPIPDSMFAGKVVSSYDKVANKKDSAYWNNARPIPLEDDEKRDFVVKDSVRIVNDDPVRKDSLRKIGNKPSIVGILLTGYNYRGKQDKYSIATNSLLLGLSDENVVNFNAVEGFNVAPKVSSRFLLDTGKTLVVDAAARYGFNNTHFNAIGRIYYQRTDPEWLGRGWLAGVEGGKYVFQYNPDNPVLQWFNTYASLFYKENDLRIYERWEGSAFMRRNYGNGLLWLAKASFQHRLPLNNTTEYNFATDDGRPYYANTPAKLASTATAWEEHNALLLYGMVSYKPGITYTQYPDFKRPNGSSWPRFTLSYEKGIAGVLDSKTDFDKWRFSVSDDVSLRLLGRLSYNFATGGFLNSKYVSIPDLMHLNGNRGIGYAAAYLQSFQFAQYYAWSNKEKSYAEGHVEYHLDGLLSNKIPLLRQLQWYLVVGGNAFYAQEHNYYTEAFVGIENIGWKLLRPLRVDFVQSWDSNLRRNSGIRFGLNGPFATRKVNLTHSEW